VLYGIKEDKDQNIWHYDIDNLLSVLYGRSTAVADAIRPGGRFNPAKTRPVLVKLQSVWDRQIILTNAHKLAKTDEFKRMLIKPDQSLTEQCQANLSRLKIKVDKQGKWTSVIDGSLVLCLLMVDGICVYSVDVGYVKRQDDL